MRSFVAVDVPASIRQGLATLQARLRESGADVKWVRPESVHLTLKFLGEIRLEAVADIREALGKVIRRHEPFSVKVRGVGCFPRMNQPRVVWVGLCGDGGRLISLQREVESAMEMLGFPPEERGFRPHLTLGRVRSPKGRERLAGLVQALQEAEVGEFQVRSLVQYQSELHPSGARYTPLWEVLLGQGGEDVEK